jgi:YHS domain-containing protein
MQALTKPHHDNPNEDPVCHQEVDPNGAKSTLYRGHVFYFCSAQCKKEFDANPQLWVSVSHAEMSSSSLAVQ